MLRTRFSFACSVAALTFSAMPAHAQSAPAPTAPTPPATGVFNTRINDIQVARDGETISILVKLSQQPGAATVKSTGEGLTLEVDGLLFNTLNLSPPSGSLVTRVEAASGKLTLSGVAFSNPTTTIYRNAVMIEAKLAEPRLQAATSIMGATVTPAPQPVVTQAVASQQAAPSPAPVAAKVVQPAAPAPQPIVAKATPAPVPTPAKPVVVDPVALPITSTPVAKPLPVVQPAQPTQPVPAAHPLAIAQALPVAQPVHLGPAMPIAPTPVALAPAEPAPPAKHETEDQLQSHPAPAAPAHAAPAPVAAPPTAPTSAAALAGIDAARCSTAAVELAKDAWALAAMGDHALCLIDAGKLDEAKNRIDQLAAITPQDWRVALGRAKLAEKAGDTETAQAAFVSASLAAPNDVIRAAITEPVSATPDDKETDLELPLPSAPAASGPKPAAKPAH